MIYRGQVYFVTLAPVIGREIDQKSRPVVVLSINDINRKPLVVMVVPGTSTPFVRRNIVRVEPSASNGLTSPTFFQAHQLRALDHSRFTRSPVGNLSGSDLDRIQESVMYTLGFGGRPGYRTEGSVP